MYRVLQFGFIKDLFLKLLQQINIKVTLYKCIHTLKNSQSKKKMVYFKIKKSTVKSKHFESRHQLKKKTGKQTDN